MKVKDNAQAGMPAEDRIGKRIVRFFLVTRWGIFFLFFVGFSILTLPPIIYSWGVFFPETKDIKHTKGKFIYKAAGKGDYVPGIDNSGREEYFGCKKQAGLHHYCINDRELYKKYKGDNLERYYFETWKGKDAELSWFNQPVYFFSEQRRLIELTVDGVVVIPAENVRRVIEENRESWVNDLAFYLIFLLIFSLVFNKFIAGNFIKSIKDDL